MERLKVYIAGKMSGLSQEEILAIREPIEKIIYHRAASSDIVAEVINPAKFFSYDDPCHWNEYEIYNFEINHVLKSDVVIAIVDGINTSIGTAIEVYEAYKHGIPVITYNPSGVPVNAIHPWLRFGQVRDCETINELADYIQQYYM